MFETVKNRRTVRKYLQKDIAPDLLNDLLETSFRASTMGGMQLYSVIVTRDAEMKEKLSPAHFNQPMVKGAPVVLTFCADFRRFSRWCEQRNAVPGYDNLMSFMNASMDTLLVAQTFCTLPGARIVCRRSISWLESSSMLMSVGYLISASVHVASIFIFLLWVTGEESDK